LPSVEETVEYIVTASSWDERVSRIRSVPARHGTDDIPLIHALVARRLYVPHLAPDYAYIPDADFYGEAHFIAAYDLASMGTNRFRDVTAERLTAVLAKHPMSLLVFRTITGLTKGEFAATTTLVAEIVGGTATSVGKIDSMERDGSRVTTKQARIIAETVVRLMDRSLFGDAPPDWRVKQDKPDTAEGWSTVQHFASGGVPYSLFLHQRHYGGAWRQVLDATSVTRGDIIEDAVEAVFQDNGVPYVRTGSQNQAEISRRFSIQVNPAPDFVVFDKSDTLRAMLECKGANDGGTARDKALRFERLRAESIRLGGIPLVAVLGGLGWTRVNDTLGPVVRDCDGRVYSVANIDEIMLVSPFPSLRGLARP
jgi:hypothetical protein